MTIKKIKEQDEKFNAKKFDNMKQIPRKHILTKLKKEKV